MKKLNFKIGDKVRVKKGLNEDEILEQYYDGPLGEETEKEILDFFNDTEKVYTLIGIENDCSIKEFGYYINENHLELVEVE
ncbi:MAG: hypothetical protein JW924_12345 [Fusobacteriaceae bacterium]|nr:hypothetical protein [Fusobacteriaceae bacterium]